VICAAAAQTTQNEIDAMPAPPPENAEDRAIAQIAFFKDWLVSHPEAAALTKYHVMKQIRQQEAIVNEWMPTKYHRPRAGLKGGVG
jgi:hypothetical protein